MERNCQPGDIARIVLFGPHYGKVIRVLEVDAEDPSMWSYDGTIICQETGERYEALRDSILKPLRFPEADEKDESFAWKRPILRLQVREMK